MRLLAVAAAAGVVFLSGCSSKTVAPVPTPPLSSVTVTPEAETIRVGEIFRFGAVALDTTGVAVSVLFNWQSLDPSIFTVSKLSGRVTGVSEGEGLLVVAAGDTSDTARVTVIPAQDGWYRQTSNTFANLRGVFFLEDGRNGWAVGDAGVIIATHDAGETWATQANVPYALRGVWFTSADEGWAVGVNGTVMHTTDAGDHWTRVEANSSEELMDVCFVHPDTGWAVGAGGLVLGTFDGGATWMRKFPTAAALRSVSFAGTRDGWAVGNGVIVGTHDTGRSWFVVQPGVTTNDIRGVSRRSEPMAVAVGAQGVVPRTVTGADSTTWQLGTAGAFNQLYGVHFPTDMIGFAVGYNASGIVLRSDDGGLSWTPQVSNSQFQLNRVFFVDERRGWAVGNNGVVIHTGSGGEL